MNRFSAMGYDAKTKGFIEALLFGAKINLDEEVQQQFKDLGILHILAVSGMHVVVLFATLRFFFRTLLKIPDKATNPFRSEERRVGKECRSWWSPYPS